MSKSNTFEQLSQINVNNKTDKRGGFTYLSWAWAWSETKKLFPEMNRTVYENENGRNYFDDGRTAWVKVGVTIDGIEHIDYLPVMNYRNDSIPLDKLTSTDVNKSIQRSTTKAIALHGLGLYIYAKEDLPTIETIQGQDQDEVQDQGQGSPVIQKKKLTAELFKRALTSITEGRYTIEELESVFELNKTQQNQINKIKKESK